MLGFFAAEGVLPVCGHGTVAVLVLLAVRAGGSGQRAVLCTASRSFVGWAVRNRESVTASFESGPVGLCVARPPGLRAVAAALGLAGGGVVGDACVASNGRPRLLLPVRSRAALAGFSPDFALLRGACGRYGLLGWYACSIPDRRGRAAARMFAWSIGVPGDIADAGSAACPVAQMARFGTDRLTVGMGDLLGSPSTIAAAIDSMHREHPVRVGGQAAPARTAVRQA
ncbi:PhzF family phenazine biosynthesis protein [Streptomyces sp. NPDC008092]|uniref:PhzF family phenazine biosynthesis protein n=1 Tax=Streptomyces sp. NPDC008092 TaxID=3364808 RepID=UPI0036EF93D0